MENFNKICVLIFKCILIICLVILFNLYMMPKYVSENPDGSIVREMYKEKLPVDIVFLGSSTVYSGISPVSIYGNVGYTSYVCATSSQTPWITECMLEEVLKYNKPKLIVLDIGFFTVEDDYSEEVSNRKAFDYMKFSYNRHKGISESMNEQESMWSYYLPALRYHERYKDLKAEDLRYIVYKPKVTYNGYVMNINKSTELPEAKALEDGGEVRLSSRSRDCLYRIIDRCKEEDMQLLFIKTPSYNAKWGPAFEKDIYDIAVENHLEYVNFDSYTAEMGIDYMNDSPDSGGHLNLYGAEKFSYYLSFYLANYFDVPDRREDEAYKKVWDNKLLEYHDAIMKLFEQ